jgi:hypothetical protein
MSVLRGSSLLIVAIAIGACQAKPARRAEPAASHPAAAVRDSQPAASTTSRAPGDHLLFSVDWMDGGVTEAEMVAVMPASGGYAPPPEDDSARVAAFDSTWLRPGHRYNVLVAGRPAGFITIKPTEAGGCNANAVLVEPRVASVPPGRAALATDRPMRAGPPLRRDALPDERRAMAGLLRAAIVRAGGEHAWRDDAEVQASAVTMPGHGYVLAGSAVVRLDRDDVAAPVNAAFIIAERGESGAWRPVMIWHHPATDPAADFPLARRLLDAADLDGDGRPEIVARTDMSEYWEYTVYRLGPRGWTAEYEASGGGC